MSTKGWVGFDLDGTLAVYDGWKGPEHIGEPIGPMVEYAKALIAQGVEVKIVTARASLDRFIQDEDTFNKVTSEIRNWCLEHLGKRLEVTAEKDFSMVMLFDDRTVTVEKNTGLALSPMPPADELAKTINWHHSPENPENPEHVRQSDES